MFYEEVCVRVPFPIFFSNSVQSVTRASSLPSSRDTHTVLSAGGGTGADQEQKVTMVNDLFTKGSYALKFKGMSKNAKCFTFAPQC